MRLPVPRLPYPLGVHDLLLRRGRAGPEYLLRAGPPTHRQFVAGTGAWIGAGVRFGSGSAVTAEGAGVGA